MTRLDFKDWLRRAETQPSVWPEPPPPRTIIRVRCIPAVYAQHEARIQDGEPFAEIGINSSRLSFPEPFDHDGHPTVAARAWLTEAVGRTIRRDGHLRIIIWHDSVTIFSPEGQPTLRTPPQHREAQHG